MDYTFDFGMNGKAINQTALDDELRVALGVNTVLGTTVVWKDVASFLAGSVIVHCSRQLTQEELNVIAGI